MARRDEPVDPSRARERVRLERRFVTSSADATERLGEALGERLPPGAVVALHGELGSGKTCFVRGLARGLGVREGVASPSFTLMHEYAGRVPVYHLDAWMQGRGEAFLEDGGAEWLHAGGVAAVEWAERVGPWLPLPRIAAHLEHQGPERRRIALALLVDATGAESQDPLAMRLSAAVRGLEASAGIEEEPT